MGIVLIPKGGHMNQENLIPFSERSQEEARELGKKGGIASGKARKEKRQLKDELELLMQNISKDGRTYQELISTALVKEALKGNTKAYEIIRDTLGQKPIEVQQIIETPIINDDI
jgi:hypothetical protein